MRFRRVRNLRYGTESFEDTDHLNSFYVIVRGQPFQKITVKAYLEVLDGMLRLNSAMLMMIIVFRSRYYRKLLLHFN